MGDNLNAMRAEMVMAVNRRKTGLLPPSFSVLEVIYALDTYIMRPEDDFILSKGHAALALYAVNGQIGEFIDGKLPGLTLCGSLGHGLPIAIGLAVNRDCGRVFCIVGDGESNEGSIWEAARVAAEWRLPIICILDANGTHAGERYGRMFEAFGWELHMMDGHDTDHIRQVLSRASPPAIIVSRSVKGRGCAAMERDPQAWHNRIPNDEEAKAFVAELIGGGNG